MYNDPWSYMLLEIEMYQAPDLSQLREAFLWVSMKSNSELPKAKKRPWKGQLVHRSEDAISQISVVVWDWRMLSI